MNLPLVLLALLAPWNAHAERCRAADGDSLVCGVERVRLYDVYAAELNQAGGRAAKRNLEALVNHREIELRRHGTDRYGRTLADAYVNGRKIVQSDIGPRAGNGVKSRYASRGSPDPMTRSGFAALRPLLAPLVLLALAAVAPAIGPTLPPSLAGIKSLGPYLLLGAAAAVAFAFNRGRPFVLALSLFAAYAAYAWTLQLGERSLAARALHLAVVVLVPANALAVLLFPERGIRHRRSWPWLAAIAIEIAFALWAATAALAREALQPEWPPAFEHWTLRAPAVPFVGRVMFALALAAATWRAWPARSPLEIGAGGALVAFYIGANWLESPSIVSAFGAAAGAILLVSLLEESHRLAFRDALTGLPNRRALEERLRALGGRYVLAMVDVDHFKGFNDAHGHDIGDQVLRLVAAQLGEVQGAGTAYRYGGEEFTLLFAGQSAEQVLPHLEKARASIERYKMAVRSADRPKDVREGSKRRGRGRGERMLSVTISLGAAQGAQDKSAAQVLKAADEALYRAKQGGRNRVCL